MRAQFQNLNKERRSTLHYINKAKEISNMLVAIGKAMINSDILLYVIRGLRCHYNSFVTSLNMREIMPSLSTLHCLLEGYECILHKNLTLIIVN